MIVLYALNETKISRTEVILEIVATVFIESRFNFHFLSVRDETGKYVKILASTS